MDDKEANIPRSTALDMLQDEHGVDPQMNNPMSGFETQEMFVDKSLLPNCKEGEEVTGRFTVGKVGTKVAIKPIEFYVGENAQPSAGGETPPPADGKPTATV